MMASNFKKLIICSLVASLGSIKPPKAPPSPLDSKLKRTVAEITFGADPASNQFIANIVGEPMRNILPIAESADPNRQNKGFPTVRRVLIQTPATTRTPPKVQPIFIP